MLNNEQIRASWGVSNAPGSILSGGIIMWIKLKEEHGESVLNLNHVLGMSIIDGIKIIADVQTAEGIKAVSMGIYETEEEGLTKFEMIKRALLMGDRYLDLENDK